MSVESHSMGNCGVAFLFYKKSKSMDFSGNYCIKMGERG